jgi:hypothetical protein
LPYISVGGNLLRRNDLIANDRYALWRTFNNTYNNIKKGRDNNESGFLEEMINDLHYQNEEYKTLNEVVQKYIKYFAS